MSFDFDAGVHLPHRMQPGLRLLAPGALQLTATAVPHRGVARHLREKLAVLWAFRDQALLTTPGFDAGPALRALAAHAAAEHPQALQVDGDQWHAPGLGWALDGDDSPHDIGTGWPEIGTLLHQLPAEWRRTALLSLAFAEDFAVLDAATGTLPWLAVALPSMWAPELKIGRSFAEVHAPVADNRLIVGTAPQLVKLVTGGGMAPETPAASPPQGGVAALGRPGGATAPETPAASPPQGGVAALGRPGGAMAPETPAASPVREGVAALGRPGGARWERFVWTLTAHPRLHGHPQRVDPARWPAGLNDDQLAAQTWWRTERQTFIPVPAEAATARQAVFTILVNVTPLVQAFGDAAHAARVHDALASMTDAVLAYRGLTDVRPALLRWLARQAAGAAA